jgi:hypothetical protein
MLVLAATREVDAHAGGNEGGGRGMLMLVATRKVDACAGGDKGGGRPTLSWFSAPAMSAMVDKVEVEVEA